MPLFEPDKLLNIVYALSIFLIGYFVAKRIAIVTERSIGNRFSRHHTLLMSRLIFYFIFTIFLLPVYNTLDFN